MTWKQKPGSKPANTFVPDFDRPFTDLTWMLVAIMLSEDQASPWQIARVLRRSPIGVTLKIAEARDSGHLARVEQHLLERDGVFALRLKRRLREAVAM